MGKDMEGNMTRTLNRLSVAKVKGAKNPGMYADGGSLYLRVAKGGSKQWIFRYVTDGRMRDMGIGPAHTLTLAEAREKARDARKLRLEGLDPIVAKHAQRAAQRATDAKAMTFRQCAEQFIREHEKKWTNAKHRHDWIASLAAYVYPVIGNMPVASVDTPLVLKVIKPLWERAPVTAGRVRGRIESVLGWATVHHYRTGDNPARWTGHLEHALPSRSEISAVKHHVAMPFDQVPAFMGKLEGNSGALAACLRFAILTAARRSEACEARWDEVDLAAGVWTVPAERMKAGEKHTVPLSAPALAILRNMAAIRMSDFVFPGNSAGRPVHGASVAELAKRVADSDATLHGFRSSFRDWASERTNFPREVCEMALAHAIPSAVEAAYRRGELLDKRRKLMDAWAAYCAKIETDAGKVVALARARTPR
jgi:integrase